MFGRRKPVTAAREALGDPHFEVRHAHGVVRVEVPYDAAHWVRCPVVGEDRTAWRDRVLTAYDEDLGWVPDDPRRRGADGALDRLADGGLETPVNLVHLPVEAKDEVSLLWLDVADAERDLLERGETETWLRFHDDDLGSDARVEEHPRGWRYSTRRVVDERGSMMDHGRAAKLLTGREGTTVHLAASWLGLPRDHRAFPLSAVVRTRVLLEDGTVLE